MIDDFYRKFLGAPSAPDSIERWLYTPSAMLRTASNGEVWQDDLGVFSSVRNVLKQGYPEDIRRKKLAAHLAFMAQAGQYNYERSIQRGDEGTAQLAVFEFVKHAISAVYLLNNEYEPFYKWAFRGMRSLDRLSDLEELILALALSDGYPPSKEHKVSLIETICDSIISELQAQGMTKASCRNMDSPAYSVLDSIKDNSLRNMHIMEGV